MWKFTALYEGFSNYLPLFTSSSVKDLVGVQVGGQNVRTDRQTALGKGRDGGISRGFGAGEVDTLGAKSIGQGWLGFGRGLQHQHFIRIINLLPIIHFY